MAYAYHAPDNPFAYGQGFVGTLQRVRPLNTEIDPSMEPPDLPHSDSSMPGASPMRPVYTVPRDREA